MILSDLPVKPLEGMKRLILFEVEKNDIMLNFLSIALFKSEIDKTVAKL